MVSMDRSGSDLAQADQRACPRQWKRSRCTVFAGRRRRQSCREHRRASCKLLYLISARFSYWSSNGNLQIWWRGHKCRLFWHLKICRLGAFSSRIGFRFKWNAHASVQHRHAWAFNCRNMDKNVSSSFIWRNKAKPFRLVEEFNCAWLAHIHSPDSGDSLRLVLMPALKWTVQVYMHRRQRRFREFWCWYKVSKVTTNYALLDELMIIMDFKKSSKTKWYLEHRREIDDW